MMETMTTTALATLLAATVAKGVLLLGATGLAALALRRAPAAGRHLAWLAGSVGLLALPVVGLVAPRWSAPGTDVPWSGLLSDAAPASAPGDAPLARVATVDAEATPRPHRAVVAPTRSAEASTDPGSARSARSAGHAVARSGSGTAAARVPAPDGPAAAAPGRRATLDRLGATASDLVLAPARGAAGVLVGLWALGAALLLASLGASLLAVARLARRSPAFPRGRVTDTAARLAAEMGVKRPVRVLLGEPGAMPVSWGLARPVVLLPEGAERWHAARLEAVLLHEMAHVRRRDCLTQVVAEVARALHWPNPLAWTAVERLRVEREHACDDRVLARGAVASDYARELLSLARGFQARDDIALAAVAMARPAHLRRRLVAVLDEARPRGLSRRLAAATVVGALALTTLVAGMATDARAQDAGTVLPAAPPVPALPAWVPGRLDAPAMPALPMGQPSLPNPGDLQEASCGAAVDGWEQMTSQTHGDSDERRYRLAWSRPGCEVEVRVEGDVSFTSDFRDVARMGRDARVRFEEDDDGTERVLDIRPGADGAPTYAFRVEGRERAFDAAARAWYEGLLLHTFRRTGFMARERVASLLRQGGPRAVLDELDLLHSDHVFATYTSELLKQAALDEGQVVRLVERARERVDSDHYMTQVLETVADRYLASDRVLSAFIASAGTVESDHYRAGILTRALARPDLPPAAVDAVLASATSIESDHYLAELLQDVARRYALEPSLRARYLAVVGSIESDHYMSGVLSTLLARTDLDDRELAEILEAAREIDSDHYLSEVLKGVADRPLESDALRAAYLGAAVSIESDHYLGETLGRLVKRDRIAPALLLDVVRATRSIESDHERAQVLLEVVRRHPLDARTRAAVMESMDGIGSDHYRGQVADALLRAERQGD